MSVPPGPKHTSAVTPPEESVTPDAPGAAPSGIAAPAEPAVPPADDPRWRRTHPASALVDNAGRVGIAAFFLLREARAALSDGVSLAGLLSGGFWRWGVVAGVAGAAMMIGADLVAWRHRWFLVGDDAVHLRSGRARRTVRSVRLDRIQSADLVRPVAARLFGLWGLRAEVADDGERAVALTYLRREDVFAVRARLLGQAQRDGEQCGQEPEPVVAVPASRAWRAVRRSPAVWGAAVGALWTLGAGVGAWAGGGSAGVVGTVLLAGTAGVAGVARAGWAVVERSVRFRVGYDGQSLSLRHGVAETHRRTLAPGASRRSR
ncbi:PH domain-containing protein [Xylanimonas allomyrinae]|uniref:PH domain-containing protein n=1 Tax=Xylanimonas allomyrinae TaxID=2509459 RepID=A0A4P6EJD4_9MICO|nr:PH domain-containing protein [Xylanimonas allomyrinae]QAY62604.1 PH domain-containing protein [Xylanimonas allomyrinae]